METAYAATEEAQFKNLPYTRYTSTTYNHTPADDNVPTPNKSARLNAYETNPDGTRKMIGPATGLKVYPGDVINMEVWARYAQVNTSQAPASAFLFSALAASFGLVSTGETAPIYNAFNAKLGSTVLYSQTSGSVPKAFLNYIFFDKNYANPVSGFIQITSAPGTSFQKLTLSKAITTEGYIYIYVSNESTLNVNVFFDDLKITHTAGSVLVQANDYYPFGLTMQPFDWLRSGEDKNKFLYNGVEQDDYSKYYETSYRSYDASLGRFMQADPLAEMTFSPSPYIFALNNPVRWNDPLGLLTQKELDDIMSELWGYEFGGSWSSGSGGGGTITKYTSGEDAFYAGADYMETHKAWGIGPGASSFDAAAQAYHKSTRILPLKGVTIMTDGHGHYSGEPYTNSNWLQGRIDQALGATWANSTQGGGQSLSSFDWISLSTNGLGNLGTFSDDFRAAAYGKFVDGSGKVYSQKFFGNQYVSKWGLQAAKATSLSYAKVISRATTTLAVVGALGTLYDGVFNPQGWQNHHTADLLISGGIYGLAAAVPVAGWIVGGAYFIGDVTSYAISGKSLSQNIFD